MRRVVGYSSVALGLVLLVLAGVVRWVVAPAMTVLPGDMNTTRVYSGTISSVINPTLLTGTLFGPGVLRNLPATVIHTVKVDATAGDNALVSDRRVVTAPGSTVADVTYRYAVDRKSLAAGSGFSPVSEQTGLTFNWPINSQRQDYVGWVSDTQQGTTLHYSGDATRGGLSTYVYDATVQPTRITDTQLLSRLPSTMPKSTALAVAPSLGMSTKALLQLNDTLSTLPDTVPLAYTFSTHSTYWIAPATGIVVDVASHEVRTVNVVVNGQLVPMSPALDFTYTSSPSTLSAAAADARNGADKITLINDTVPVIALGVGAALVLIGGMILFFNRRRRTPTAAPPVAPDPRELVGAGSR